MRNVHKWYSILMLLSLDDVSKFLTWLHFPKEMPFEKLQRTIREVIEELATPIAAQNRETQIQIINSFDAKLSRSFSSSEIDSFMNWSDSVHIGTELEKSMQIVWTFILLPLRKRADELRHMAPNTRRHLVDSLVTAKTEQAQILQLKEEAEAFPRGAWDTYVVEVYNGGVEYSPNIAQWITPYDYVNHIFKIHQFSRWLQNMHAKLSREQFEILNNYIAHKITEKNANIEHKSLREIMDSL